MELTTIASVAFPSVALLVNLGAAIYVCAKWKTHIESADQFLRSQIQEARQEWREALQAFSDAADTRMGVMEGQLRDITKVMMERGGAQRGQ